MARRSFVRGAAGGARRGERRLTAWGSITSTTYITIPASSKVLLGSLSAAALALSVPGTLVRVRGSISVGSDQGAALEEQIGAVGLGIVQETARVAGVASLPDPVTEADAELWNTIIGFNQKALNSDGTSTKTYPFESKAMRKVEDAEALVVVGVNNHATHGLVVALYARFLFKLH